MTSLWQQPIADWTQDYFETYVLAPASQEHSRVELKSSEFFDVTNRKARELRNVLAKNISAFGNYEGGLLVFGARDAKRTTNGVPSIDGGAPQVYAGRQSSKEWLENVIPALLDPPFRDFDVHAFGPDQGWNKVKEGHAVIVVEVRGSDFAPHQHAEECRYYGRFGSSSKPLSHQQIEDIRSRLKHPKLECRPFIDPGLRAPDRVNLLFEFTNVGRRKATHVSVLIFIAEWLRPQRRSSKGVYTAPDRRLPLHAEAARALESTSMLCKGFEVRIGERDDFPILPTCSRVVDAVELMLSPQHVLQYYRMHLHHMPIAWEVYADDAPPLTGWTTFYALGQDFDAANGGQ